MAFVTEKKGNKFAKAITGALEGASTGVDMVTKIQNANTQRQFAQAQIEELNQKKQDQIEKRKLAGNFAISSMVSEAIDSDDPKAFLTNKQGDFEKARSASGTSMTYDAMVQLAGVKNEKVKMASKSMFSAKQKIAGMTPFNSTPEQMASAYNDFDAAYNEIIKTPELSESTRASMMANKQEVLSTKTILQKQFVDAETATRKDTADTKKEELKISGDRIKDARLTNQAISSNTVVKKLQEQNINLGVVDTIADEMKAGNTVAASALGIKTAKAMGEVGVMTEQDIIRYITSKQLARKVADKFLLMIEGKPTNLTTDEITALNGVIKAKNDEAIRPIINNYVDRFAYAYKITKEEAIEELGYADFLGQKKSKENTKTVPAPKKGTVEGGYEFQGGDPSDKNNWKKI